MPYVTVSPSPGVYNIDKPGHLKVTITCHDALSGLSNRFDVNYGVDFMSPIVEFDIGKCCEDNAGNLMCDTRGPFSAKTHGRHPDCGVELYYLCRTGGCGVQRYDLCTHRDCGVSSYKSCRTSSCGVETYEWTCSSDLAGTRIFTKYSLSHPYGGHGYCGKSGTVYNLCTSSACGIKSYKQCRTAACGVDIYYECRHSECGIERYKECWHYGLDQDIATH